MTDLKTKKSIVIYFSRADENYGVGYIEKWNTEVIAEYIPIYRWQLPQPMVTQLEKLNWEWKIVRPFTTHEGSGLAWVPSQLKNLCQWAEILDWLAIRGSSVYQAKETVENWL